MDLSNIWANRSDSLNFYYLQLFINMRYILNEGQLTEMVVHALEIIMCEAYERNSYFNVIKQLSDVSDFASSLDSLHWSNDRSDRRSIYIEKVRTIGSGVYSFLVDTGHPNGYEIHTITEKGFIVIQNNRTKNIITILAARPGQIKRYWLSLEEAFPKDGDFSLILRFAANHAARGLNNR